MLMVREDRWLLVWAPSMFSRSVDVIRRCKNILLNEVYAIIAETSQDDHTLSLKVDQDAQHPSCWSSLQRPAQEPHGFHHSGHANAAEFG